MPDDVASALDTALLRRRRGSSTSAGLAPRSTTGRSPSRPAGRSSCASRTPTRSATTRSGRVASSTPWRGSASPTTTPRSRARTSRAPTPRPTSPRPTGSSRPGQAYYCDLTPEQIQERSKASGTPGYDGYSRDRGLGPGPGRVLRFRTPDEGETLVRDVIRGDVTFANDSIEDFALLRGNGTPMFLLANVVDDIEMGITHVVRGEEHLPNTPKQQLLWQALGKEPPVWAHVPVLVNEQRKKLSKRRDKVGDRAVPRRGLPRRRDGQLPHDARLVAGHGVRASPRSCRGPRSSGRSGSRTSPTRRRSSTSRSWRRSTATTSG